MREVKSMWLKLEDGEKAYFARYGEFGVYGYDIVIVPSDPTKPIRIKNVQDMEFVGKDYKKEYLRLLEKYDELDAETCIPRSNYWFKIILKLNNRVSRTPLLNCSGVFYIYTQEVKENYYVRR